VPAVFEDLKTKNNGDLEKALDDAGKFYKQHQHSKNLRKA